MAKYALVLGGGGARGAYEAGVLWHIAHHAQSRLGRPLRFSSIVGTSAGAINAAFLAAWAHDLARGTDALCQQWRGLGTSRVYRMGIKQVFGVGRSVMKGFGAFRGEEVALVDATPLHDLIRKEVPWPRVQANLDEGHLDALAVVATELATSRSVVFVQEGGPKPVAWDSTNPYVRPRPTRIRAEHVLASSAIPLLFPPVEIDSRWYIDGGVGMNTPIRPALRLGADRILVVSVRKHLTVGQAQQIADLRGRAKPTWAQVVGKTMNAVLLDRSNHEVERMERINELLRWGRIRYGEDFAPGLSHIMEAERGAGWREIEPLLLDPSVDLGALASEVVERVDFGRGGDELTRRVLKFLAHASPPGENDALSYLLFEPSFLERLIELGRADAAAREDEIFEFLGGAEGISTSALGA